MLNSEEDSAEATSLENSGNTAYNESDYTADYGDFVSGNTLIFNDKPVNDEVVGKTPSKWIVFNTRKSDNTEIVEVKGEKIIRLAKTQGISPLVTENEKDYIPDNFTLEFDASFSANSLEQRYYITFYNIENQNDFVEPEVRDNELTFTTFGVTDNLTEGTVKGYEYFEESSTQLWRNIAIRYQNNTFEIYYDGQHIFHKGDIKGNLIGITISRSDFGTDDRYLKNITLATNN